MTTRATLGFMNPIALIEATAAGRCAVLGALATDPVDDPPVSDREARDRERPSHPVVGMGQ
jgi:hypothetical protein